MTCPNVAIPILLTGVLVPEEQALAGGQVGIHYGPASDAGSAGCVRVIDPQAAIELAALLRTGDLVRVI